MNRSNIIFGFLCLILTVGAQTVQKGLQGNVSFISSENAYINFTNTRGIQTGDTLWVVRNGKSVPALLITGTSSISAMGKPFAGINLRISEEVTVFPHDETPTLPVEVASQKNNEPVAMTDHLTEKAKEDKKRRPANVYGRISVSAYGNVSDNVYSQNTPNLRMRYNLSLNADRLANGKLSFDTYLAYTHKLDASETWKDLKVFSLGVNYKFDKTMSISFGRRINMNTANIGAVDGIQFEKKLSNVTVGGLVGSRPNDSTYGISPKLFQYGAFVAHEFKNEQGGSEHTSLAFFNQTNTFKTDRRYIYLQHTNSLLRRLDFFGSTEIDLYSVENNVAKNTFNLTSLYLSLNYQPTNKLSLSLSYDARKNLYFFETYKNKIDSLLEKAMRQGMRFRFNYRPFRYFSWGGTAGYRIPTPMSDATLNASSYVSYARIPWINTSLMLSGSYLKMGLQSGFIYGGTLSKDLLDGNMDIQLEYRREEIYKQHLVDLGVSWKLPKNFFLTTEIEGALDSESLTGRLFLNLTKRF